jgi:hypothetical protein
MSKRTLPANIHDMISPRDFKLPAVVPMYQVGEREAINFMKGLKAKVNSVEKQLKSDQQVFMYCWHGHEKLQVVGLSMPSDNVISMRCQDSEQREVHVTGHMHAFSFSIVVHTIKPPAVRVSIGFEMPQSSK